MDSSLTHQALGGNSFVAFCQASRAARPPPPHNLDSINRVYGAAAFVHVNPSQQATRTTADAQRRRRLPFPQVSTPSSSSHWEMPEPEVCVDCDTAKQEARGREAATTSDKDGLALGECQEIYKRWADCVAEHGGTGAKECAQTLKQFRACHEKKLTGAALDVKR